MNDDYAVALALQYELDREMAESLNAEFVVDAAEVDTIQFERRRKRDDRHVLDEAALTVDETASLLRTTRKAVYALIERGQLPGVTRLGRRVPKPRVGCALRGRQHHRARCNGETTSEIANGHVTSAGAG